MAVFWRSLALIDMGDKEKILIVDDDVSNLDLLDLVLGQAGYEVVAASEGEKGLELIDENFKIAFIDMHIPGIDGIDIIRDLRQRYPNLFISAATMDDSSRTIKLAFEAGADMFLVKPYSIATIAELVRNAERGQLWLVDRLGMREYHPHKK